jgi:hypothetical protein
MSLTCWGFPLTKCTRPGSPAQCRGQMEDGPALVMCIALPNMIIVLTKLSLATGISEC